MSERLFRSTDAAPLDVIDVHVNARPDGMASPAGFYHSESLTDYREHAVSPGCRIVGALVAPPAGVDLYAASLALRTACDALADDTVRWGALLRFDGGPGARPPSGLPPLVSTVQRWRRRGWRAASEGRVTPAIRDDPGVLRGFAGIKLMPHVTGLPEDETLEHVNQAGLPLIVHAGSFCPVPWLEAKLLPRVRGPVILAHLGSWPCSADDLVAAVELARTDSRVFLETSGASIGNFIRHAVQHVPYQVLFGSNSPMCRPAVQWQHVSASIQDDAALERVANGNARRAFEPLFDGVAIRRVS